MTFLQFLGGGYAAPEQEEPTEEMGDDADEEISFSSDALDEEVEKEEEIPPVHTDLFPRENHIETHVSSTDLDPNKLKK